MMMPVVPPARAVQTRSKLSKKSRGSSVIAVAPWQPTKSYLDAPMERAKALQRIPR